jgi:hypothetical protein
MTDEQKTNHAFARSLSNDKLGFCELENAVDFLLKDRLGHFVFMRRFKNPPVPKRWLKIAILLPCLLISPFVFATDERPELLNSGSMADKIVPQDAGNTWRCEVVAVPNGNRKLRLCVRECGTELGAGSCSGVSDTDESRRPIANAPAEYNSRNTHDSVTDIESAFNGHFAEILFLIGVIPAWFTGWFFAEWLTEKWISMRRKWWSE